MIAWHGGRPRQCHPGGWHCQALESVSGPAGRREGRTIVNYRRITELFGAAGAAAGAVAVGAEIAQAQDLGESIANAVTSAVSTIDTNGGSVTGGTSMESSSVDLASRRASPSPMRAVATITCLSSAE